MSIGTAGSHIAHIMIKNVTQTSEERKIGAPAKFEFRPPLGLAD
jgi:hypothetical protein